MGVARSVGMVCKWCKAHGYVNPKTGRKPKDMAVWFRMYRWMIRPENQEVAYKIFKDAEKNGEPHFAFEGENRYQFNQWIKKQAKTCLYKRNRVYASIVKSVE